MPLQVQKGKVEDQLLDYSKNFKIGGKKVESLQKKTALIVGFGSIGQNIGRKLKLAFNMKIIYFKRSGPISTKALGYKARFCEDFDNPHTWKEADVIILSLPGGPSTENIINKRIFSMCKQGVRVVNVGRGSVIQEEDLLEALESGKVASAGLDVFKNEEEMVNPKLIQRWDVTAYPHIGSTVADMIAKQTDITLANIEDIFVFSGNGKFPVY